VLAVDDDDSMREAIERLLDAAGFRRRACASADALLAPGVDHDLACVIGDLSLPGMHRDLMPCDSTNQNLHAILTP
jgi:FixJ family two-component response regulator